MEEFPKWLTETFLESVLKMSKENIKISELTIRPAKTAGNNFYGYLYRVQITCKTGESLREVSKSLIVKKPIEERNEQLREIDYEKEPLIYNTLLPRMLMKINIEFGPLSFNSPIQNVVIMSDLNAEGYLMCASHKQLDYVYCKQVFKKVAKFHATSVSCYYDDSKFIADTVGRETLWAEKPTNIIQQQVMHSLSTALETVEEMQVDKRFATFLSNRQDFVWKSVTRLCQPKLKGINVLNHGDLWVTNMMFKLDDESNVTDVKFLDFQFTKYTSPVVDLIYFLWSSANEDVRQNKQIDLYNLYLKTFNESLEQLGCKERMTVEELKEDLTAAKEFALLVVCHCVPIMWAAPEDAPNLANLTPEDFNTDKYSKLHRGQFFTAALPGLSKSFAEFFLSERGGMAVW